MRPIRAAPGAGPLVDLRTTLPSAPTGAGAAGAWDAALSYVHAATGGTSPVETIKRFDRRRGADQAQVAAVLAALDSRRPVAFYGWWPTAEAATTTAILGVDAMEVPPPDRKGAQLVDGHAVVLVGYGRHDAFPGGGYVIVRSGWRDCGWGDDGDGYMPLTFLRAYATELCTVARSATGPDDARRATTTAPHGARPGRHPDRTATTGLDVVGSVGPSGPPVLLARTALDDEIDRHARCADPRAALTHLFFSDDLVELARARAICSRCTARTACLQRALERREPWGVWGGELVVDGAVVGDKRGRGRPPKVPRPRLVVDEVTGEPLVPIAV